MMPCLYPPIHTSNIPLCVEDVCGILCLCVWGGGGGGEGDAGGPSAIDDLQGYAKELLQSRG